MNPRIRTKAEDLGEAVISTCIPVDNDQNVQDKLPNAESIRVASPSLRTLKQLQQAIQTQKAIEAKERGVAKASGQGKEIGWKDGANVKFTQERPYIRLPQAL